MAQAKKKQLYLVTSSDGSWHFLPCSADSPEQAVLACDQEAENVDSLSTIYCVHEVLSAEPVRLSSAIRLVRDA